MMEQFNYNLERKCGQVGSEIRLHVLCSLILIYTVLCTYPVIPSFVHVCIYFEWFSPVAIFRTGLSFVEDCCRSFRAFLQSDN